MRKMESLQVQAFHSEAVVVPEISRPRVSTATAVGVRAGWWVRVAQIAVLMISDFSALLIASFLGYLLWAGSVLGQPFSLYLSLIPLLPFFLLAFGRAELYPGFGLGAVEMLRRLSVSTSYTFVLLAGASFALKISPQYSRMTFFIAWGASFVFVPAVRFLTLSLAQRWSWWGEPVVLAGSTSWISATAHALEGALSLGYRPIGALSADARSHGGTVGGLPLLGGPTIAARLAKRGVRVLLVEERDDTPAAVESLHQHFPHVVVIRKQAGLPIERVRIRNFGGIFGIEFTNDLLRWQNRVVKRTLDLVLGSAFLLVAAPIIAASGLLVKLLSRGPVFFSQERRGLGEEPIRVWKLRTMHQDAEQRLAELLASEPQLKREWEEHYKLSRDPRIVPWVGKILRRFSLDELPQFWGVVRGEMSLVGPRPFPDYHLQRFPGDFRKLRARVRPGLTGLWQVTVRSNGNIEQQRLLDTYYIRNWSIWLDVYIVARTAAAVLLGRGAS